VTPPPSLVLWCAASVSLTALSAGCDAGESATNLNPAGPPMIRQLLLTERTTSASGATATRPVIAFGHHPDASDEEQHPVTTAVAAGQRLRVVIDELLVGNYLEEIECNEQVDDDFFSRVPVGATPQDIANCAVVKDLLPKTCKGSKAVCLRASDGVPVGVRDQVDTGGRPYKDGIADVSRFVDGAASVRCGADGDLAVPMDLARSYWQPSGNQQRPAIDDGLRGLLSLGPAVVLVPRTFLPAGQPCFVVFGDGVVDKSGLRPCAPANGDVAADCTPGDTAKAAFTTEVMALTQQSPLNDAVGVSRTVEISVRANVGFAASIAVTSIPPAAFTVTPVADIPQALTIRPTSGLAPATRYIVSVPLRDSFGVGPAAPARLTFTTAN
jgi:hypothetical protein